MRNLDGRDLDGIRTQALTCKAKQGRHKGQRDDHRDGNRAGRRNTHDGKEGDADDDQRCQRDDDGQTGEHDRAAGGANCACNRFLDRERRIGKLFAMAGDDEEGIVDADRQAEHQGERR